MGESIPAQPWGSPAADTLRGTHGAARLGSARLQVKRAAVELAHDGFTAEKDGAFYGYAPPRAPTVAQPRCSSLPH